MIFRDNDVTRLRSIGLFSRMSEAHFRKLARAASLRRFPARALLFREGERHCWSDWNADAVAEWLSLNGA